MSDDDLDDSDGEGEETPWDEHLRDTEMERLIADEVIHLPPDWEAKLDQWKAMMRDAGMVLYYVLPHGWIVESTDDPPPDFIVDGCWLHKATVDCIHKHGGRLKRADR